MNFESDLKPDVESSNNKHFNKKLWKVMKLRQIAEPDWTWPRGSQPAIWPTQSQFNVNPARSESGPNIKIFVQVLGCPYERVMHAEQV